MFLSGVMYTFQITGELNMANEVLGILFCNQFSVMHKVH